MSDPCVYCGGSAEGLDHIRAATRGGVDGWENRAPACARCDQTKRNASLLRFMWASNNARRRVERRERTRVKQGHHRLTIQQRIATWTASTSGLLDRFDEANPSPTGRDSMPANTEKTHVE